MHATLAAYFHTLDPFLIEFPDGWPIDGIRWYGLSYLAGFALGYFLIKRVAKAGKSTLTPDKVGDLVITLAISIVIGGRLGYVLFYKPSLFADFSSSPPFWGVLAINEGGMASHGGMIGAIIGALIYARRHGHSWCYLIDLVAFAAPPGLLFGRIANFINGELVGRECPKDFPLAVKFPQDLGSEKFWPAKDLEVLMVNVPPPDGAGEISRQDYVAYVIREIQNGNQKIIDVVEPLIHARYPSQLLQGLFEGVVLMIVLAIIYRKPRKPLVLGSAFFIVYGLLRIASEQWRMPDSHLGFQALGLTRGQWLSIAITVVGLVFGAIFIRRNVERQGGWMAEKKK